ncbi:MAG: ABC-type transporter, integral membrane subunit [candidate division TA06 bacterium 34_109]|uniref:ABC-type transporter, integral membrane subunit n=1 Tax=candidate division TA06 bacterium 34_109 TaxID=1635277 RepID=A0A101I050_UNCT6|nr:MAG: ABC-type transporter, integral membrane subunit [candidate division TA06 bacterium 34_109]
MRRYIVIRLIYTIVVIFGVSILVFLVTHVIGDPVNTMLPLQATEAERIALAHELGLDRPIPTQLSDFLMSIIRLDFGNSWWQQIPALGIVLERIPATLILVVIGFLLAVIIALPLGILAAYKQGSTIDRFLTNVSLLGISFPPFWIALMLILFFAVRMGWVYTSGYGTFKHAVLPILTISLIPAAHLFQIIRTSIAEQLNSQYVITARAKGVKEIDILFRHTLKNAACPVITMFGFDFGRYLAGEAAAVEVVFGWPGIGTLIVDTIGKQDFPLLQAEVFTVALVICIINLITDISYAFFNPTIKY